MHQASIAIDFEYLVEVGNVDHAFETSADAQMALLDFLHLGSSISMRSLARMSSSVSVVGLTKFGSSVHRGCLTKFAIKFSVFYQLSNEIAQKIPKLPNVKIRQFLGRLECVVSSSAF